MAINVSFRHDPQISVLDLQNKQPELRRIKLPQRVKNKYELLEFKTELS